MEAIQLFFNKITWLRFDVASQSLQFQFAAPSPTSYALVTVTIFELPSSSCHLVICMFFRFLKIHFLSQLARRSNSLNSAQIPTPIRCLLRPTLSQSPHSPPGDHGSLIWVPQILAIILNLCSSTVMHCNCMFSCLSALD